MTLTGVRVPDGLTVSQLEREIRIQGEVLARRAARGRHDARRAAALLDVDHVVVAARGSSDNAARYAQYLFGHVAGLSVGLAAPWLFGGTGPPPRLGHAALLAVSQSGQSPDIVAVAAAARAQRRPVVVLTNDTGSPLAAE